MTNRDTYIRSFIINLLLDVQNGQRKTNVMMDANESGRFESRFSYVRIQKTNSIMLKDMEGSVLGVWVAHGEGKLVFSFCVCIVFRKLVDYV